jgi:SNF2 family DNA or RNA helicase
MEVDFIAARCQWDVVIIDEAHYLKNSKAKRTCAVYGNRVDGKERSPCEHADHVWCLTGTPLLNNPGEFWTHLHALAPERIHVPGQGPMTEDFFLHRFCVVKDTPYGVRILGAVKVEELRARIAPFVHRKRIKDVILDLPDLRIVEHPLPEDTPISDELRRAMEELLEHEGPVSDEDLLAAFQSGAVTFASTRRLIGRAKVPGVSALARDTLEDDQNAKLIVFAHHREVIRDLAEALKDYAPLVIHGDTPSANRTNAINVFQSDPKFRLIILAIEAAGEAITLTAARNVILAEPSPVPAQNHQAIARAHRKGQKSPVLARFVLLPGTLDEALMRIIARKTRDIAKIVDPDLVTAEPTPATAFPPE